MSMVEHMFDESLARRVALANDRACGGCEGRGERGMSLAGDPFTCSVCAGTGINREEVTETHYVIFGAMAVEVLGYACAEFDASRMGNVGAAMDWWRGYLPRVIQAADPETISVALELAHKAQGGADLPEADRVKISGQPLSDVELAALGLADSEEAP